MRITIDIGPSPSPNLKPDELLKLIEAAADAFRVFFPRDSVPFDLGDCKMPGPEDCNCAAGIIKMPGMPHSPFCPKAGQKPEQPEPNPPTSGAV